MSYFIKIKIMPKPDKPCGCGFGHKKKCGFGFGNTGPVPSGGKNVNDFFINNFTGPANFQSVGACLEYGVYGNYAGGNYAAPLVRFGSTKKSAFGPMKIGKSKMGK